MADNTQPPPTDTNVNMTDELDASIEADNNADADATQPEAMNLDGANDVDAATQNGIADVPPSLEARIPAKKDATLREFLGKMDDYAPIVCSRVQVRLPIDVLTPPRYQMQSQTII